MRETFESWWPQVRATLVALHVLAITLLALPAPEGGLQRSSWQDPTVQQELAGWAARLGQEPEVFEEALWTLALGWMETRTRLLAPLQPYYRTLGTYQSWRMFVAPHRHPTRLEIDVRIGGAWHPVFVERSREHTWLRRELENDRMRSVVFRYAWPAYQSSWEQMVAWLALRAARDFPEATHLRARFRRVATPPPAALRAGEVPEGEIVQDRVRGLGR